MFSFGQSSRQAKKKQSTKNSLKFHWRGIYSWLLLIVFLSGGISYLVQNHTLMPIKTIQLSGTFKYIDQQQVEASMRPFIGQGFFSVDIQEVSDSFKYRNWSESVSIRRIWPDRLLIKVIEKVPVARWDENNLLSNKGQIFQANTDTYQDLPLIYAANVAPDIVLNQYYYFAQQFQLMDEVIDEIRVNSRGSVSIQLAQSFNIKLGRDKVERKMERLFTIYEQQIKPRRDDIQQLDLRYSNGLAIAWKDSVLTNKTKSKISLWRENNV